MHGITEVMLRVGRYVVATGLAIFTLSCVEVRADNLDQLALTLGEVMGAEELCEISLDPDKVRAFIRAKVPADSLDFMQTVNVSAELAPDDIKQMSPARMAAHCEQMSRLASKLGLVK